MDLTSDNCVALCVCVCAYYAGLFFRVCFKFGTAGSLCWMLVVAPPAYLMCAPFTSLLLPPILSDVFSFSKERKRVQPISVGFGIGPTHVM